MSKGPFVIWSAAIVLVFALWQLTANQDSRKSQSDLNSKQLLALSYSKTINDSVLPTENSDLGISAVKPDGPYFVELPNGKYMVPYTETIPGTSAQFTMIPIPGGTFLLGSPNDEPGRNDDEGPQIEIVVEPFWMGQHEVTWKEYHVYQDLEHMSRRLKDQGKFIVDESNEVDGVSGASQLYDPSFVESYGSDLDSPAATMTQYAAKQYTKMLSLLSRNFYRLPTEAEWEYACRAGTKTAWYFGDNAAQLPEHAHFGEGDWERKVVGKKRPNPWGLYDMYGNVAEWTLDLYFEDAYSKLREQTGRNPLTVAQAWLKSDQEIPGVIRGGGVHSQAEECRSASRWMSDEHEWKGNDVDIQRSPFWYTNHPATYVGFRLIRPLVTPTTRTEFENAWKPAYASIGEDDRERREDYGHGAWLVVNPDLAAEIRQVRTTGKLEK